jgi:penicillin amidase
MNSPGQSGDPGAPHYSDLFAPWTRDASFPLLYSREAVAAAAVRRLVLSPAGSDGRALAHESDAAALG